MKGLTAPFVDEVCERLSRLEDNAEPSWGQLTAPELVPHLIGTFRFSMNEIEGPAFTGNWFTTTIVPPIIYTGWFLPPKNLKTKSKTGENLPAISSPGDVDTLRTVMEQYIERCAAGSLETSVHPFFGDIGPEGWSKLHVLHTKHHLKQFRL